VVQKRPRGREGTWPLGFELLSFRCDCLRCGDFNVVPRTRFGTEASTSALGFAVSQRLRQMTGDVLQVSDGSLYPALHKLETL
jgi:hypothetical protein